jgi:hypothetical protein
VLFVQKTGESFTNDQADIQRLARVIFRCAAPTFKSDNVSRVGEYEISSFSLGDNLLQVFQANFTLNCNQLFRSLQRDDLAMIGFGKCYSTGFMFGSVWIQKGKVKAD